MSVDGRQLYPGTAVDAIDLDFIAASMLSTVNVYSSYLLYQNPETKIQKERRFGAPNVTLTHPHRPKALKPPQTTYRLYQSTVSSGPYYMTLYGCFSASCP